jgi:hypothetical protein
VLHVEKHGVAGTGCSLLPYLSFTDGCLKLYGSNLVLYIFETRFTIIQTASVVYWSEFLATDPEVWFPALPDFLRSSGYGTGSTQPREDN